MLGTIKVIKEGGYGFIIPDGEGKDIFFHVSKMADGTVFDDLREGDKVEFETFETDKGINADNVRLAAYNS